MHLCGRYVRDKKKSCLCAAKGLPLENVRAWRSGFLLLNRIARSTLQSLAKPYEVVTTFRGSLVEKKSVSSIAIVV